MGRKSTISRLDPEIKSYIEAMLATGGQTLDELIADLRERFPAAALQGELPSRSAVGRYGLKLDRKLSAIRASTEAARLICQHAGDTSDDRSEALTALVSSELFDAILDMESTGGEEMDAADRVGVLSKAAKNIATLTRSSVNVKKFRAEVEEATRQKLLEEQRAKLNAMENKGGVTDATKQAIREALGIT